MSLPELVARLLDGLHDDLERRLVGRRGRARSRPRRRRRWSALRRSGSSSACGRSPRRSAAPRGSVGAPTGRIMNSWMSRLLSACAPPLMMFIIGTGMTGSRPCAAEVLVQRQLARRCAAACALASETASNAFAPSRPLFSVPSSSIISASMPAWSRGVVAEQRLLEHGVDVLDGLEHALAAGSASCRRRAARRPRACRWRRPRARPRGPCTPDSSTTSASTVGLPRESMISRPRMSYDSAHNRLSSKGRWL